MQNIRENLQRTYDIFIDEQKPLSFFKGLAEYVDYVFGVPTLKEMFVQQLTERNNLVDKLVAFREKTEREMHAVADALLDIVDESKLDLNSFASYDTFIMEPFKNVVEELIAYKKGGILSGGFWSGNVERYLIAISLNLVKKGFREKVEKFIVSREKLVAYFYKKYGQHMYIPPEKDGEVFFIFSETLPTFCEQERLVERERSLKPWGSFEKLYQFAEAYKQSSTTFDPIVTLYERKVGEFGSPESDAVEVTAMQSDVDNFLKAEGRWGGGASSERPRRLLIDNFKPWINLVHARLMRVAPVSPPSFSGQEIQIGPLLYATDGTITFKGEELKIRSQIKTLCVLFMKNHKRMLDYTSIHDELISADKRHEVDWETTQKYVSELHILLKKHFKKEVIFLAQKEGYTFDTTRSSK